MDANVEVTKTMMKERSSAIYLYAIFIYFMGNRSVRFIIQIPISDTNRIISTRTVHLSSQFQSVTSILPELYLLLHQTYQLAYHESPK